MSWAFLLQRWTNEGMVPVCIVLASTFYEMAEVLGGKLILRAEDFQGYKRQNPELFSGPAPDALESRFILFLDKEPRVNIGHDVPVGSEPLRKEVYYFTQLPLLSRPSRKNAVEEVKEPLPT